MDALVALERAYDHMGKTAANVTADQLSQPSACAEWDLRALLNHAFGAGWMFTLANQGASVPEDAGDIVGDDPAQACAAVAEANLASWRTPEAMEGERTFPFGTFPAPVAILINLGEVQVHAWDLAKSTGQDATIDPEVADILWDFYRSLPLDQYRQYGAFGPEVPVPETAPTAHRVLGLIGFQP